MLVHAIQAGTLTGNRAFLRSSSVLGLLAPSRPVEFPVLAYAIEHPDGLVLVDTGMDVPPPRVQRSLRRIAPEPSIAPGQDIASGLRGRGLDPGAVTTVVVTHLDWDHVGGVGAFPRARVLVHRLEMAFAGTRLGRMRVQPERWPESFAPELVDLDGPPLGPFAASRTVVDGISLVPLPGHSPGQAGVVVEDDGPPLLLCADHVLSLEWFEEGRALGQFMPRVTRDTSARVERFVREWSAVLLPAHDAGAPARLAGAQRTRSAATTRSGASSDGQ